MNRRELLAGICAISAVGASGATSAAKASGVRSSVIETDPGYEYFVSNGAWTRKWRIFLDGVEIEHVKTADENEGFVLHNVLDANGAALLHPDNPSEIWMQVSRGSVRIVVE